MHAPSARQEELEPSTAAFYREVLITLTEAGLPFLVGGAFALRYYAGIVRHTKDLDLFVRPADYPRILEKLADQGYRTELTNPKWLAKVFADQEFVDVIFGSGKGLAAVDEVWFEHAVEGDVLGLPVRLCPVEEMTWSKAFIMERERFDGADIAHLIRARGERMDWRRLLGRFEIHWRVLLSHLVLFGFVYPNERSQIPDWVLLEFVGRLQKEMQNSPSPDRLCQGPFLSDTQYLPDLERWGYQDARLGNQLETNPVQETAHLTNRQGPATAGSV
jgi:Uncharacterised nucleotidyltransferase